MVDDIASEDFVTAYSSPSSSGTTYMMYGYKKGYTLNALWGFRYGGVWHNQEEVERNKITKAYASASGNTFKPGYARYQDINHDGALNSDDLVYLGSADPDLYGGIQNTFNIHNFTFSFFFNYSIGGKIYNVAELWMGNGSPYTNQYKYMQNSWHPVRNPNSNLPMAGSYDALPSDRLVHDASYLRLKNISASYTFDMRKVTKNRLRDIRVSVSGEKHSTCGRNTTDSIGRFDIEFQLGPAARRHRRLSQAPDHYFQPPDQILTAKTMKSYSFLKKYLLAATATAALLFSACDLDEHPTSFVGPKEYYKTRAQCLAGLNACYIPINSIYDYCFLIMTEGVTDLMYIASGTKDAQLDISPAKPLNGQKIWTQCYKGVMYCNSTIAAIERSPLNDIKESSEADKLPLLAEGVVIRSFYYWLLTCIFGDVPFYTKEVADQQVMQEIAHMGRMSAKETRDYLIDELQRYVPSMDQVRSSEVADNRMGAAMGWMMIAKLAQWNHRWDDALEALGELEKIYGDLQQYPLEDIMFRNKNTPESIFEVQRTYTPGGLSVTTNVAAITTPYHNGKGIYDGVEIPEMGTGMTTWTSMRPNSYFCDGLQTKKSNDKRKTLNMAWEYDGKPFSGVGTRPWLGPKFWCPGMQNTADFSNQKVFRYADAILMMAECYAETEDSDEAVRYLNMVRERAGTTAYVFKNKDALLEEIQKERGRELLGEFQRKFDLVRWGIWYQMTYEYTNYPTLKTAALPCHEMLPDPRQGGRLFRRRARQQGL